jgi:hypothetical protein
MVRTVVSTKAAIAATCIAVAVALPVTLAAAQVPAVDWKKQEAEILRHHRALVQIDSSSPPGNETKVDDYLKKVFEAEAFRSRPSRCSLRAPIWSPGSRATARSGPSF